MRKNHESKSKVGMKDSSENTAKTRDHLSKYFPHMAVILIILGILVTLTLNI